MSEWKEIDFAKVLEDESISYGIVQPGPHVEIDGIPIVRVQNIKNGKIIPDDIKKVHKDIESSYLRTRLKGGELLITVVGSVGECAIVTNDFIGWNVARAVSVARIKNTFDKEFIRYCFATEDLKFQMYGNTNDTVQPTLNLKELKTLKLLIPELPEQKAIAEVLSSLDDKIDLLHRQNKTLEQMAETLFRQWFVEEAKEDWDYIELGGFIKCYNGVSYKSSELNPSDIAMVTLKSFARDGSFRLDGFKEFTGNFKAVHIVKQGDLVVAHTDITQDAALVGNPVLVIGIEEYKTLIISMDLVKVEPKFKWMSKEFLYFLMKSRIFKQHCLGYANGSTVLHLSKDAIPTFEFFLPPKDKIEEFSKHASWLLNKKNLNISQIRSLEKLRDTLLPKLMSGEVRVKI